MRPFFAVALLLLAAGPQAPTTPEPPRGRIVDKIACAGAPEETYALYLPAGYTPERAWPILYVMDPRSRGTLAAERFRAGAEKYGFILASSNNTLSDGPMEPNIKAMRAMWADTHGRLRIDERRTYAAGFSGTVRSACMLARSAPGTLAGVVAAGAGFPFDAPPRRGDPFVFFGTIGDKDFNYYEVMDLEPRLEEAGVPHRIEIFDGIHQWPPEELATRALGWLELQAMKSGARAKDPALIDGLWTDMLSRARAAEGAGDLFQAHRLWSAAAADFAGLRDAAEAARKTAELAASPALQHDRKERAARIQRDKELLAAAPGVLGAADPATVFQVVSALKIRELRERAKNGREADDRLSAQRVLNTIAVQTGYYLPTLYNERKQYDRAVFVLSIAAEVSPDDPFVWYNRAAAYARKGDRKRALADLRQAVDKGWKDGAALQQEEAFSALRKDPEYQQITGKLH
jgi:tetratricopeptide (TPR) repeat protein